jgi:hypothetical protein
MPLQHLTQEGSLAIGGVAMANQFGAWGIVPDRGKGGLIPLWTDFEVRGENRVLPTPAPSVTGVVIPYQRRITQSGHDLRLLVTGDIDGQTGATPTDAIVGLEANLAYLTANVIQPPATASGTRAAVLTMPSGATRTADVQVLRTTVETYLLHECGSLWIAKLRIDIPGGRFT